MPAGMGAISKKKLIGAILGICLGIAVGFALWVSNVGLTTQGCQCLGILVWAIVWWIAGVLPEYATGILMAIAFCIIAGVETSVTFNAFSSSTWWLLVSAFTLGAGMKASGLMRRMALGIIRLFPNTFLAQAAGLIVAGTVLGPLVPSLSAKMSLLIPISCEIGDAMGYKRKGKQMQGLFLATMTGIRNIGPAVISASIIGYGLVALLPIDVVDQFDMLHWFIAMLPWFIVVTFLNFLAIAVLYSPKEKKAQGESVAAKTSVNESVAPWSLHEKEMLVIILVTVIMWIAEPLHGISSHVVALAAMVVTIACGILGKKGFREGISWESLIFIGTTIGLASVFSKAGIESWIVNACGPVFEQLAGNPFAFVLGIGVITILLRFVIVSEMAYVNIVMVLLIPLALNFGINPWVVGVTIYCVVNPWFTLYQNSVYLSGFYSVDGEMVRHSDMAKYCVPYMVICLIGLAVSVPFWQAMGLFG